jgi:hypothetical protein
MGIYRRLPIMQSAIAARCRKLWLIAASTLVSLALSEPTVAQNLTPVANGGTLGAPPLDSMTTATGTFDTNINLHGQTTPPPGSPALTLTLTLEEGVHVTSLSPFPGGGAVNLVNLVNGVPTVNGNSTFILVFA